MERVRRLLICSALAALASSTLCAAQDVGRMRPARTIHRVAWAEGTSEFAARYLQSLRDGLAERGFREGHGLELRAFGGLGESRIDWKSYDQIQPILDWKPHVIVVKSAEAVKAFRKASSTIPIVFTWVPDPVLAGLVETLARPGGNATGVSIPLEELAVKRVELLKELLPPARRVAVLFDSRSADQGRVLSLIRATAQRMNLAVENADAAAGGLEASLSRIRASKADAVLITGVLEDPRAFDLLLRFQADARIPLLDDTAESAEFGMLLALGEDGRDHFRRAAHAVAKILEGANPSTIPVDVSTRILLWVNAGAARRLDIRVPESILVRADRVIR